MKIYGSNRVSGIRRKVFDCAGSNYGYSASGNEITISYDGNELVCHILFASMEHIRSFRRDIQVLIKISMATQYDLQDIQSVTFNQKPNLRIIEDLAYVAEDSSSNLLMSETTSVVSFATLTVTPLVQLQMIENPENVVISNIDLVRCHLISKQKCDSDENLKAYDNDENNCFYMSWIMHQRFDGLYSGVPSIAIRFGEVLGIHVGSIQGFAFQRTKVSIVIEFLPGDDRTPQAILPLLKEHSYDYVRNEITLNVSVVDADKFRICLNIKYTENTAIWNGGPNFNQQSPIIRRKRKLEHVQNINA